MLMSLDYPFSAELPFLDFRIRWHANQQILIDILQEQFLYSRVSVRAVVRDNFDFYIDMIADADGDASWNTALQHRFDPTTQCLHLSYLDNAIQVRVNYREKSVRASIMERALAYRAALGNWVLTIPFSELLKLHGIYLMHAACLVKDGTGILFAGRSGVGKTTLAIGLLSLGWQLVSDDEIFLWPRPTLLAYGGPERAKVSWPTWRRFSYYLGEQNRYNGKQIITLEDHFPDQIIDSHSVAALCFVGQSDRVSISPLDPMQSYQQLLSVAFLTSEPALTRQNNDFLYRFSREIPAYRLQTGLDVQALDAQLQKSILP